MTIDTLLIRKEIEYCEQEAGVHRALASQKYEERDPMASSFHACAARLFDRHVRNLRGMMVIHDYLAHID